MNSALLDFSARIKIDDCKAYANQSKLYTYCKISINQILPGRKMQERKETELPDYKPRRISTIFQFEDEDRHLYYVRKKLMNLIQIDDNAVNRNAQEQN